MHGAGWSHLQVRPVVARRANGAAWGRYARPLAPLEAAASDCVMRVASPVESAEPNGWPNGAPRSALIRAGWCVESSRERPPALLR